MMRLCRTAAADQAGLARNKGEVVCIAKPLLFGNEVRVRRLIAGRIPIVESLEDAFAKPHFKPDNLPAGPAGCMSTGERQFMSWSGSGTLKEDFALQGPIRIVKDFIFNGPVAMLSVAFIDMVCASAAHACSSDLH